MPARTTYRKAGEATFGIPSGAQAGGDVTVKINGVTKTLTTDYTVHASGDKIVLVTPLVADSTIEISYADRRVVRQRLYPRIVGAPSVLSYTNGTRTVAGEGTIGYQVGVYIGGVLNGYAIVGADGKWAYVLPASVANGAKAFTAKQSPVDYGVVSASLAGTVS